MIGETDIWADEDSAVAGLEAGLERDLASWIEYESQSGWSVVAQRHAARWTLRNLENLDTYGADAKRGGMENALTLLNAELRLSRAAFPDMPLYVVKVDLKDFYPTLPHDLLLALLARLGLSEAQLDFFRRYLALPLQNGQAGGEVARARRGVPNERARSDLLGELVISALDWYVEQRAQVNIIRLIDDIAILTPSAAEAVIAWAAVQEFCATFGLAVNLDKCGSVCIGRERPERLPQSDPVWSLLTLDDHGRWNVAPDPFAASLTQAREHVAQQPSLLAQVQTYNTHLQYLLKALGVRLRLDAGHRDQVSQALLEAHQQFFGPDQGIVPTLQARIREQFLGADSPTVLPEAWLYWPITAGGCGLLNGMVLAASYARHDARLKAQTPPDTRERDWQTGQSAWTQFFALALAAVQPDPPEPNQVMESLVSDFIARGSELSSGKQDKLASYWRWVLYIYGPQVLESLGTFRYLITELVPLQLTARKQGQDMENVADEESEDGIPF